MLLSQRAEFDNPSSTSQATMTAPKRIPSDKTFDVMVLQFVAGGKYGVIAKVIGRPRPARKAYSAPYPRGSAPVIPALGTLDRWPSPAGPPLASQLSLARSSGQ